ncbi:hypothetical protein EYF80_020935 [Liparis tanakae]|uniref:Uncharacterized protein n=1 Tax=Liparis tanakae TaxID=230148 RepID=A0A4Z2HTC1_9TELE|nr:hypothetical protein EYF80_020935 [Liparis tanakae]
MPEGDKGADKGKELSDSPDNPEMDSSLLRSPAGSHADTGPLSPRFSTSARCLQHRGDVQDVLYLIIFNTRRTGELKGGFVNMLTNSTQQQTLQLSKLLHVVFATALQCTENKCSHQALGRHKRLAVGAGLKCGWHALSEQLCYTAVGATRWHRVV